MNVFCIVNICRYIFVYKYFAYLSYFWDFYFSSRQCTCVCFFKVDVFKSFCSIFLFVFQRLLILLLFNLRLKSVVYVHVTSMRCREFQEFATNQGSWIENGREKSKLYESLTLLCSLQLTSSTAEKPNESSLYFTQFEIHAGREKGTSQKISLDGFSPIPKSRVH